jgi:hypothetical protein
LADGSFGTQLKLMGRITERKEKAIQFFLSGAATEALTIFASSIDSLVLSGHSTAFEIWLGGLDSVQAS